MVVSGRSGSSVELRASSCLFLLKSPLAGVCHPHCAELQQVSVGKLTIPSFKGEGGFAQCGHCRAISA